jgi:hypothetical protein
MRQHQTEDVSKTTPQLAHARAGLSLTGIVAFEAIVAR